MLSCSLCCKILYPSCISIFKGFNIQKTNSRPVFTKGEGMMFKKNCTFVG